MKALLRGAQPIEPLIRIIRGQGVLLASDLARIYGVPTKRLSEAVKRALKRFPSDFAFVLKRPEATSKGRGGRRSLPRVHDRPEYP